MSHIPHRYFYRTPTEFYKSGGLVGPKDPADTAKSGAGVLDKDGKVGVVLRSRCFG